MDTLFVSKDCSLKREDNTLVIIDKLKKKRRIPIEALAHIVLCGESGVTTSLLSLCGKFDVRITVLDWYGNVSGCFEPFSSPRAGRVRLAQASFANDPTLRLDIAKRIVQSTHANLIANLRYRLYRGNESIKAIVEIMDGLKKGIEGAEDIQSLMGFEGNSRSWYYNAWPLIDPRLDFGKRVRRPPNNPINCLISWFNGLAYSLVKTEIAKSHLDDCISFLHSPREARYSLALDISESIKSSFVDPLIFEIILRDTDIGLWFDQLDNVCRLNEIGRKNTLDIWTRKIDERRATDKNMRDFVRDEVLSLERHILGIGKYEPYQRKV